MHLSLIHFCSLNSYKYCFLLSKIWFFCYFYTKFYFLIDYLSTLLLLYFLLWNITLNSKITIYVYYKRMFLNMKWINIFNLPKIKFSFLIDESFTSITKEKLKLLDQSFILLASYLISSSKLISGNRWYRSIATSLESHFNN